MKYLLPYNCDSNHGCVTESMIFCIVGNGDDMVATTGMIVSSNSSAAKKENENSNRKKAASILRKLFMADMRALVSLETV